MKRLVPLLLLAAGFVASLSVGFAQQRAIQPGAVWPDTDGNHIQAHGGGIIKVGKTFYWYGEQRKQGLDTNYRYVSCYSSKDLINWKDRGNVIALTKPDTVLQGSRWVLERPKVYYNRQSRQYVMYMHLDGTVKGASGRSISYGYARVGVAVSRKATGPFTFVRSFRPLGKKAVI
jgi:hypothetical protein